MSSFVRRIQRQVMPSRRKDSKPRGVFYANRGLYLGVEFNKKENAE